MVPPWITPKRARGRCWRITGIASTARARLRLEFRRICPQGYDKPDNAARITHLGVGAPVETASLSGERLAARARALFSSERVAEELREPAIRIKHSSAIGRAVGLLEQHFAATAS